MSDLSCDIHELKEFQRKLERLNEQKMNAFCEACAKELAARLLSMAQKRTPVGVSAYTEEPIKDEQGNPIVYKRGAKKGKVKVKRTVSRQGGTLRRGWTCGSIERKGDTYIIEVINPVEYAPYVEYGHRQTPGRYVPALGKKLKKGWVNGKFMLTLSVQAMDKMTPALLEKKLNNLLKGAFDDS